MQFGGTAIYVDSVPEVLEFYGRAFGLETRHYDDAVFDDKKNQYGVLDTGSVSLAFASHGLGNALMPEGYIHPDKEHPSNVEVAFFTDDVAAAFATAVGEGAIPLAEPREMPWGGTVAYVRSIEGTLVGLCSPLDTK